MTASFSDKSGWYRGTFKDGMFTVWNKGISKKEFSFAIACDELKAALNMHGNSHYAIRELVQARKYEAEDRWVADTRDTRLRERRRKYMYDDADFGRGGCLDSLATDSACRVVVELWRMAYGEYPKSWLERIDK